MNIKKPSPMTALDWSSSKASSIGNGVVSIWQDYLTKLPSMTVARNLSPNEIRSELLFPIPELGLGETALLDHIKKVFFDYSTYAGHPGFLAYIMGAGTVPSAIADFVSAAINQNVGGWRLGPGATEIELHLFRFFADLFGLPQATAGGLVTPGGALSNFIALKVARDKKSGESLRREGMYHSSKLIVYASARSHVTINRAVDMLGLGLDNLRQIETDAEYCLKTDVLIEQIEADLRKGHKPMAVIATAGTTSIGSIDPLNEIALICKKYDIWLHVDGAYGAVSMLSDIAKPLFSGIEHADSISFDPHKWLYISQSAGCVIFRDKHLAERAFVSDDDYVFEDKEATGSGIDFSDYGPQWSRSFDAFKIWLSFIAHGTKAYADRITHDIELTKYLADVIKNHKNFELISDAKLSICCFRYIPSAMPDFKTEEQMDSYLNIINEKLLTAVQLDGRVFPSNAIINNRFVLRTCIVNFRTETEHLLEMLNILLALGEDIAIQQNKLTGDNNEIKNH